MLVATWTGAVSLIVLVASSNGLLFAALRAFQLLGPDSGAVLRSQGVSELQLALIAGVSAVGLVAYGLLCLALRRVSRWSKPRAAFWILLLCSFIASVIWFLLMGLPAYVVLHTGGTLAELLPFAAVSAAILGAVSWIIPALVVNATTPPHTP